jgi:N-acetylglucosaminyldiphosphoundecaprenol N-acetyl-beta-D-mannosaminyltransferase
MNTSIEIADTCSAASYNEHHDFEVSASRERANILGVAIDPVNMEQALSRISAYLRQGPKAYVCALEISGVLEALQNESAADAYAHAAINLPDGMPTVWLGRLQGYRSMDYVTGPALMREVFRRRQFSKYSHFLYGGKPEVANDLASTLHHQYPWNNVLGTYTPPFHDLTSHEESELIEMINTLKPDIVWVGISSPRQDIFMQRILPHLNTRMMFGVGAAFDFLTGRIRICPDWVKRAGFHWLHRLAQDPKRLWRRNLRNTTFFWHLALQLTGVREYSLRSGETIERKVIGFE